MTLFNILLTIHIICGGASLLLGMYILLTKKGNQKHKLIGNIYFYSMMTTSLVALVMAYLHESYFLFIVGVFTTYMLLSGKRYLKMKKLSDINRIDYLLTTTMLLFGAAFMVYGSILIFKNNYFGIVLLAFGLISLVFVYQDITNFRGKSSVKNFWKVTHLQRMVGSYIAAFTAFFVVNNTILPGIIAWLLPTILFVPLIIIWSNKYAKKKVKDELNQIAGT